VVEIRGSRRVARLYGGWPTFSGAEVTSFCLRKLDIRLDLTLHYWRGAETLVRYDCPRPFHPDDNHRLIRLSFAEVELVRFEGFGHENVVDELQIIPMRVILNPEVRSGFRLEFTATDAWVRRILECDQYGAPIRR
jgi:Immunity protein 50